MKKRHKGYFNEGRVRKGRKTGYNHILYGTEAELIHWHKIMRYGKNMSRFKTKIRIRRIERLRYLEGANHE